LRPQLSIGRMRSRVPCEVKKLGLPEDPPSITKPAENAATRLKRSPFRIPSAMAEVAPSENQPMQMRAGSTATVAKAGYSSRFTNSTSGEKLSVIGSQGMSRDFGARIATPASSGAESRYQNISSAL